MLLRHSRLVRGQRRAHARRARRRLHRRRRRAQARRAVHALVVPRALRGEGPLRALSAEHPDLPDHRRISGVPRRVGDPRGAVVEPLGRCVVGGVRADSPDARRADAGRAPRRRSRAEPSALDHQRSDRRYRAQGRREPADGDPLLPLARLPRAVGLQAEARDRPHRHDSDEPQPGASRRHGHRLRREGARQHGVGDPAAARTPELRARRERDRDPERRAPHRVLRARQLEHRRAGRALQVLPLRDSDDRLRRPVHAGRVGRAARQGGT